jgi:hypothetical protein
MIEHEVAQAFANEWITAWNSHDLDQILSHYTEDFQFSSPLIREVFGESSGVLNGMKAIRQYWSKALERRPDLQFSLVKILVGVESIIIVYSRHDGRLGAEQFEFGSDGKVIKSSAHYEQ